MNTLSSLTRVKRLRERQRELELHAGARVLHAAELAFQQAVIRHEAIVREHAAREQRILDGLLQQPCKPAQLTDALSEIDQQREAAQLDLEQLDVACEQRDEAELGLARARQRLGEAVRVRIKFDHLTGAQHDIDSARTERDRQTALDEFRPARSPHCSFDWS